MFDSFDNLLLVVRSSRDTYSGWSTPGGEVERGERFEDALLRELTEEVELEIAEFENIARIEVKHPQFGNLLGFGQ